MWEWRADVTACLVGSALLLCSPGICVQAQASAGHDYAGSPLVHQVSLNSPGYHAGTSQWTETPGYDQRSSVRRGPTRSYSISCVPYARKVSGILIVGNAWKWWGNAAGQYARGDRPETGSVLAFRSNFRMPLGHVAVVRQIVNAREVIVDHANWPSSATRGGVSHDVTVVDVSEANNWSAVRVQLSKSGDFGSVYPTYGFIFNRPDTGTVAASFERPAPLPAINRVPSDLRPVAERPWHTFVEVAESPASPPQRFDLQPAAAIR